MTIQIEYFKEQDRRACAEILASLPDWFGLEESNRAYISILGEFPTAVARVEGTVVGFAALEEHTPHSVELHVLAVRPDLHRQGIGTRLVTWAEEWCTARGVRLFHVKTRGPSTPDPGYEKTRQFYLAQGFEVLFESTTLWGAEDAALILVKSLESKPE